MAHGSWLMVHLLVVAVSRASWEAGSKIRDSLPVLVSVLGQNTMGSRKKTADETAAEMGRGSSGILQRFQSEKVEK